MTVNSKSFTIMVLPLLLRFAPFDFGWDSAWEVVQFLPRPEQFEECIAYAHGFRIWRTR